MKNRFFKFVMIFISTMFLINNILTYIVYAQTNTSEVSDDRIYFENMLGFENKKVYEFYMDYEVFNDFKENASKDFLYSLYKKDTSDECGIYEYSLAKRDTTYVDVSDLFDDVIGDKFLNVRKINGKRDFVDSSYYYRTLVGCELGNDKIDYDIINDFEPKLNSILKNNGVETKINGACVVVYDYPDTYKMPLYCVFTDNGTYMIEFDNYYHEYTVYNLEEFNNKFSVLDGSFLDNNKNIDNVIPKFIYGKAYISIRDFLKYMNCEVYWDESKREFGFVYNGKKYQSHDNYLTYLYYIDDNSNLDEENYWLEHTVFDSFWHPNKRGFNIDGKLYFSVDEVTFLSEKLFNKKLFVDDNNKSVSMIEIDNLN